MPRIFDNIEESLLPALLQTLDKAQHADFCVGYLNLRGWSKIDGPIHAWTAEQQGPCRVLVGMQRPPEEDLRELRRMSPSQPMSNQQAHKLRQRVARAFREQLTFGLPTGSDEAGLRRLARQLRAGVVRVKLFLRHPLHAKLYLLYRDDYNTPRIGYVGSSNLTLAGLQGQGELNVDVVDQDAATKLEEWFQQRWDDRFSIDITEELAEIIDESWAGERPIPPYHIYLKIAYHLSREARTSLKQFQITAPTSPCPTMSRRGCTTSPNASVGTSRPTPTSPCPPRSGVRRWPAANATRSSGKRWWMATCARSTT